MADLTYKAGIVGLGFIGGADQISGDALGQRVEDLDGTHQMALSNHPRVELVAGSSRDAGRRERFAERTGAVVYDDWRRMLDEETLDIVSIATYTPVHAEITVACADRGIRAVYCEKPVASTMAQADSMLQACERAGTLLTFNHNLRFHTTYRRLRDHIANGGLGELTSVSVQWPTGRLGNVGTHMFDAIQMVTGRPVMAVSGLLDEAGKPDCRGDTFRDPGGWGMLRLEGGLMVSVDAADYARVPPRIRFNGTEGRALTSGHAIDLEYWGGDRREHWAADYSEGTGMDRAVREIVDWLDDGTPFPYAAGEAVRTLEAIIAFHASHRRGTWVELPLKGPDRDFVLHSG